MYILLLVAFEILQVHAIEEIKCSKYDFEEKVLKKVIRMEIQMEKMKAEFDATASRIENTRSDVDDALKHLDSKLGLMEKKTEHTLRDLQSVAEKSVTPTVAFRARLDKDLSLTQGQTIVFPVILLNEGGGYSSDTGIFTTPVNGTYIFSLTLCPWTNGGLTFNIAVDGLNENTVLFYGNGGHTCYTSDTNVVLAKDKKVWVQVVALHNSGTHVDFTFEHRWNTFSGTLIHI